jgi:signal peptidase I
MSTAAQQPGTRPLHRIISGLTHHLPTVPEALAWLLTLVVAALFLNSFVLQPYLIPSESMERTLLVGDFLLVNKQVFAPSDRFTRWLLPYRDVARGDIVIFHHPQHPYLVKRVVGIPGDRLRIEDGRVTVNGYLWTSPTRPSNPPRRIHSATTFPPGSIPIRRSIQCGGSRCRASPGTASWSSPRENILCLATIAITVRIPATGALWRGRRLWPVRWSSTSPLPALPPPMCNKPRCAGDDRLGHDRQFSARLAGFARWKRIFHVVH